MFCFKNSFGKCLGKRNQKRKKGEKPPGNHPNRDPSLLSLQPGAAQFPTPAQFLRPSDALVFPPPSLFSLARPLSLSAWERPSGQAHTPSPLWPADNRDPAVSRPLPHAVRRPDSVRERNRAPILSLTQFWQDLRAPVSYKLQGGSLPPSVTSFFQPHRGI